MIDVRRRQIVIGTAAATGWLSARSLSAFLVIVGGLLGAPLQAGAQPQGSLAAGQTGHIEFQSLTVAGPLTVPRRVAAGLKPAVISGELTLPPGTGRIPAMVIAHGSGGVGEHNKAWARFFVANGIAAFIVDSFTGRGIVETATNQELAQGGWSNAADAIKAMVLLATHPRIDPSKIGVIGGSRGGMVALYTAFEEFASGLADSGQRFAVHFALYPFCGTRYVGIRLTGRPVHFLLGERDDYTPARQCEEYAGSLLAQGVPIEVRTFRRAHHGYDRATPPAFLSNVQTAKNCNTEYDISKGVARRLPGREMMTREENLAYFRTCMIRGATVGGEPRALADVRAHVLAATKALGWGP